MKLYKNGCCNIAEIPFEEIKRIDFATCKEPRETLSSFYNREKPDVLINGGFFNMTNGKPVMTFKDEYAVKSQEDWLQYGVGIIGDKTLQWSNSGMLKNARDYLSAYPPLVENGKATNPTYNVWKVANRSTLLGWNDTILFLVCADTPGVTMRGAQNLLISLGCKYAINLDGGGSTHMLYKGKRVTQSGYNRAIDNVVAVYLNPTDTSQKPIVEEDNKNMTENEIRQTVIANAKAWLGFKESNGSHRVIIDTYNNHKPLAVGYKVKYTDAWCATFVSAVAIKSGLTNIIPTECSCVRQIELFKKLGRWMENDAYVPKPGDIIYYDWQDNGVGDNVGVADHVGIVESVSGNIIKIIEGNRNDSVAYREIAVNGRYIRGYGIPDYKSCSTAQSVSKPETVSMPTCRKGNKNTYVKTMQTKLIAKGYSCGSYGADGSFGPATLVAVKKFQKDNGLVADGICGPLTWAKLNE